MDLASWAIEAEGLERRYGTVEALRQVSFSIRKGEFFSLLGPSGCGKTTLLRLIAGLDLPDAGRLRIDGKDAGGIPAHKRPVNTVFQSYALFPHLNIRQNIAFGLKMKGVPSAETRSRVDRIMEVVAIEDLGDRYPAQISGGQKQRVALARAIVNEPQVLLLDEPLGALDLKLRRQLQDELQGLQRRLGITFIHVTHDQEEALVMSDRIAVMNAGRIEQLDTGRQLYDQPRTRFVAQFLGTCNLISGRVQDIGNGVATVGTEIGALTFIHLHNSKTLSIGGTVHLALRPEKLHISREKPSGCGNVFSGVIQQVIYGGASTQYQLDVGAIRLHATLMNNGAAHQFLHEGDRAYCILAEESLVLLEDE